MDEQPYDVVLSVLSRLGERRHVRAAPRRKNSGG
jgi:hypothetical protein